MKTAFSFEAASRETVGTSSARALRNQGLVPSVLYGHGKEPVHFAIKENDIKREYFKGGFFGKPFTLVIDGKDVHALPKDVQIHSVNDHFYHADFVRIEKGEEARVLVPIKIRGRERCKGLRRGGNLNVVRYDLELMCDPELIPEFIEINIQDLNIGDSVHISQVALPEGVRPAISRDFTILAVAGRVSKATREAEAQEAQEEAA
jgi:large subunit ribosomal protein L25